MADDGLGLSPNLSTATGYALAPDLQDAATSAVRFWDALGVAGLGGNGSSNWGDSGGGIPSPAATAPEQDGASQPARGTLPAPAGGGLNAVEDGPGRPADETHDANPPSGPSTPPGSGSPPRVTGRAPPRRAATASRMRAAWAARWRAARRRG